MDRISDNIEWIGHFLYQAVESKNSLDLSSNKNLSFFFTNTANYNFAKSYGLFQWAKRPNVLVENNYDFLLYVVENYPLKCKSLDIFMHMDRKSEGLRLSFSLMMPTLSRMMPTLSLTENDKLMILKFVLEKYKLNKKDVLTMNLDLLDRRYPYNSIERKNCIISENNYTLCSYAVKVGNVDGLKFLIWRYSLTPREVTGGAMQFIEASKHNQFRMLKWLAEHYTLPNYHMEIFEFAAVNNNLEMIQWFYDKYDVVKTANKHLTFNTFNLAAQFGSLDVMAWIAQTYVYDITDVENQLLDEAFSTACEYGHKHVIDWMLKTFESIDKEYTYLIVYTDALAMTAENGHLDILKWLCDRYPIDRTDLLYTASNSFICAVSTHRLDVLKWMKDKFELTPSFDIKISSQALLDAIYYDYKEIAKWLTENFCTYICDCVPRVGLVDRCEYVHLRKPVRHRDDNTVIYTSEDTYINDNYVEPNRFVDRILTNAVGLESSDMFVWLLENFAKSEEEAENFIYKYACSPTKCSIMIMDEKVLDASKFNFRLFSKKVSE